MKESFANMRVDSTKNNPIDLSEADVEIAKNTTNPQVIAELAGPNIKALPGTSITYDASPTEIYDDVVTSYDWDFDGDGNYDLTTTQPKASHIYSSVFAGTMAVKVSTSSGLRDTASRQVTIGDDVFKPNAKAPTQLTATRTSATTAFFQWSATDPRPYHWLISLNDFPMGQVIGSQLFINISELRGEQDNTLTIRAVSKDGDLGDPASIMLPKNAPIGTSTISSPTESIISLYNSLPPSTKNIFKAVSAGWGFTTGTVKGDSTLKPTESQLAPKKKISTYAIFMIAALLSIVSLMAIVIIKRAYQFNHSRQLKGL
jgi:PKD repeat protein